MQHGEKSADLGKGQSDYRISHCNLGINESGLRSMTGGKDCALVLWVGSKRLIKRRKFEKYLGDQYSIWQRWQVIAMSEKRRDRKDHILRLGELQRNDGEYEYRYYDKKGVMRSIYSWKLIETDTVPQGKRCKQSLRELDGRSSEIWKTVSRRRQLGIWP